LALHVVHGGSRHRAQADRLAAVLQDIVVDGTVYLGYPVFTSVDRDQRIEVDALLISKAHGLVAFRLSDDEPSGAPDWEEVVDDQDQMYTALLGYLSRHDALRRGRNLAFTPHTATLFANEPAGGPDPTPETFFGAVDKVGDWIETLPALQNSVETNLQAALERITNIKPLKKRASVADSSSKGGKLKEIERQIANLDRWQRSAAIETPDGPQRIRGLAGSGKTVVLALKAAYWHTQFPEWRIAFTFQSRALYQQIDDLVTRFTFEHTNDRPDPDRLSIAHTWGGRDRVGLYMQMAEAAKVPARDFNYGQATYGRTEAFAGVCRELLEVVTENPPEPIYDAVLIDEAQDLPPEFFRLVYAFTAQPKRIVWGYDELQKLSEASMPTTLELFGRGADGENLISLESAPGTPERDVVLPRCYRNTPWALATAHAIGLGIYREEGDGLLQHPDEPALWTDIGYEVHRGALAPGEQVTLRRRRDSYPEYFEALIDPADAVAVRRFDGQSEQDTWVAREIARNLSADELEHEDILIVLPDAYTAKTRAPRLIAALARHEIPGHLVGVNSSADEIFRRGSIAIAHIHRAKGNEAPMVYAVDAHHAGERVNRVTRRNTLFTAITRSRAWVRVTGVGGVMRAIEAEISRVVEHQYELSFAVPTPEQIADLRHLHRDRGRAHEQNVQQVNKTLEDLTDQLRRGEVELPDLDPATRERLIELLRGNGQ